MADILEFDRYAAQPDPAEMSREQLREYLASVQARIAQLDRDEPPDMNSEEYELWGDRHEDLEDLADEITDRLEELGR